MILVLALSALLPDLLRETPRRQQRNEALRQRLEGPVPGVVSAVLRAVLHQRGLEVGDYGYDDGLLVQVEHEHYQVFLEGWGEACVRGAHEASCTVLRQRARAAALRQAQAWRTRGFDHVGVVSTDDPNVWFVSWAIFGPLSPDGVRSGAHLPRLEDVA